MKNKRKRLLSIVLSCTILISGGGLFSNIDVAKAATNAAFSTEMKAAGFPDSYITGLTQLHKQYPQWKFEAVDTGLDWGTVIYQRECKWCQSGSKKRRRCKKIYCSRGV